MSEKRFEVILNEFDEVEYIMDKKMMEDRDFAEFMDFVELLARNKDEIVKENEQLRLELETHKHPLWSTREAERKLSEVTDNLADEVKKNGLLNEELNQLRIENMRLKKRW